MDNYNDQQINQLISATQAFYARHAASFSQTRQHSWEGWLRLVPPLEELAAAKNAARADDCEITLLDVACGNFRFARFLADQLDRYSWRVYGIDSCDDLAEYAPQELERVHTTFTHHDVISALVTSDKQTPSGAEKWNNLPSQEFDAVVCFGFMHHVPTYELRQRLMSLLVGAVCPGGVVAVSFWRFLSDRKLALKAEKTTQVGQHHLKLEMHNEQDKLLGWQASTEEFRYCHSFEHEEIDALIATVADRSKLIDRYVADGKSGLLNEYVVLRRS
ncbi:class I SAM-dependent methyltransferase [Adlercreutzia agrestimuris]|uniref:class I SAM-dependent methyltransferase n=1 Tax=Adlercreutzia agrestimuris TaxID=2941324 RepID=UPI00203A4929|nr:class I SAM-dependent methyltransferase [Adlercreutzia agrestimuris]